MSKKINRASSVFVEIIRYKNMSITLYVDDQSNLIVDTLTFYGICIVIFLLCVLTLPQ